MTLNQKITLSFLSLAMTSISLQAGVVRGIVFDKTTKEALIGATVRVKSIQTGTLTASDMPIQPSSHTQEYMRTIFFLTFHWSRMRQLCLK